MRPSSSALLLVLLGLVAFTPRAEAVTVPPDFVVEDAAPGAVFNIPVAIAFLPDGRFLVGEKRGRVYEVRGGVRQPNPLVAIDDEVLSGNDRGLLGIAVDPQYSINHYLYLLYTVDPDSNGDESDNDAFSRLTRYQVGFDDSASVIPASRTILLGDTWTHGAVSASAGHTIGALRWGEDGSLLAASGDAAQFNTVDAGGRDPGAFGPGKTDPYEDIGAFRAQYVGSLSGKILRLDPATGLGLASNPFATADLGEPRSKVWCYGMRNPYRFAVRPGTGQPDPAAGDPGTLYIGDVGWFTYEEIDVAAAGGENFGWPCFEGIGAQSSYQGANPAHHGCGSIGTPDNPSPHAPPLSLWHHTSGSLSIPPGITGITATGGVFYTSSQYPPAFRNQYFYADYGHHWIRVAVVDSTDQLTQVLDFADEADGPIDLATHPVTGDVHYLSITSGQVRRIRYTGPVGDNNPPVASLSASPTAGAAPLGVAFSSAGSFDADGDSLARSWLFGDGGSSSEANPFHLYQAPGAYQAQLTVSDGQGGLDVESVTITVLSGSAGFPATAVLDDFNRPDGPIGDPWVDDTAGLFVADQALTQSSPASSTVWSGGSFGASQEAYLTLASAPPPAAVIGLMLATQGTSGSAGHVEVAYHAAEGSVSVSSYAPSEGWIVRGTIGATFGAGDTFGARINSPGLVTVYQNGSLLSGFSIFDWGFATAGGRLGLTLAGLEGAAIDDFGGGTVVPVVNTRPTAQIVTPLPNAPYHEAEEIALLGTGSDSQTPPDELVYEWVVDLHHNIHIHPAVFTFEGPEATMIGEDHDDGTGVFFRIHLIVTDAGGLKDTTHVDIYPEVDLEPAPVTTIPASPIEGEPVEVRFHLRNHGRMPAPLSRWALLLDGVELAARDTLVPAEDSVLISVAGIVPAAGLHLLRIRADSLDAVVETDEANNVLMADLVVETVPNTPPVVQILTPSPGAFFFENEPIPLSGTASDGETPDSALTWQWVVDLHHDIHVHPAHVTFEGPEATLIGEDHEDGSGVFYRIHLIVTDAGGLADTAHVDIHREVDLEPAPVSTVQEQLIEGQPVEYRFRLHNHGRMPAPPSRWALLLDGVELAARDTTVPAEDSVLISVAGIAPAAGHHQLRIRADSLDTVVETQEANNILTEDLVVGIATQTAPIAGIAFPTGPTYGAPDTLTLISSSTDLEDPVEALALDWTVMLHRPAGDSLLHAVSGDSAEIVLRDYEVNEAVTVEVSLRVTDSGGLADSVSVVMRPDCNLSPSPVVTNAWHLAAGLPVEASFRLRNFGAHSARLTHWSLMLDGQPFAEGDREVRALDSATVHVTLPGGLSEGPHHFRSVADTLDVLIETDETDNAAGIVVEVPATTLGITGGLASAPALSAPRPNPSRSAIEMTLELPRGCEVAFEVLDLQGRVVSPGSRRFLGPGSWTLRWDGRRADGSMAGPGRYFAKVGAGETELVRELTRLR